MLEVGQPLYLVVLLGGALLAAVYLLPIVYKAYFKEPPPAQANGDTGGKGPEAPWTMLVPVLAASALTVVLGIAASVPGLPLSLAQMVADAVFR
jgi:multicomponent Na+:H+ antiporter subunit D